MSYAGIEEAMLNGWGVERSFLCHVHEDTRASASVNSVTGLWFCYSCHAAGKVDLDRMEIDPRTVKRAMDRMAAKAVASERIYPESWLDQFDALGPGDYWLGRYSEEVCREFRLGQAHDGSYATIPYRRPGGALLGVIRRDLTGKDPAKYRYPADVDIADYLFNFHQAEGRTLLLTEGATDVIAAWEAGFKGAMATYGSSLSRAQVKQVLRFAPDRVVVAYDQDEAGHRGYEKVAHMLRRYYQVERLWWTDYKDLASIPVDDRRHLVNELDRVQRVG